MSDNINRAKFSSRLGFILISAGCAIGLGNVWRFPYIVGKYGGAAFVLIYLIFLAILGIPVLTFEFSVGRASRQSIATSFNKLEPKGTKWHLFRYFGMLGNYLLMAFYTSVAGWMIAYFFKTIKGDFKGLNAEKVTAQFGSFIGNPKAVVFWMIVAIVIAFFVCSLGLQKGVERITKGMMVSLFVVIIVLVFRSITLKGAMEGIKFYLVPDFKKMFHAGFGEACSAAVGQAFFTLGLGIGSMAIFGSYIDKDRSLVGESINVAVLDTIVAFLSGLIIFPACFSFGVDAGSGPSLVFITLPNIFNKMAGGRFFGALFFILMSFAALSTLIAVFENIIAFGIDLFGWSRKKSVIINLIVIIIISLPAALGFNLLSFVTPFGAGSTIQDLEDFIVSNNIIEIGSLVYLFFCTTKLGWGFDNFIEECNEGKGLKFPKWAKNYCKYILPLIIIFILIQGYISKFF